MYGSFYKEVLPLVARETIGFAKRRVVFPICIAVPLAIALAKFGAAHLTADALRTNLIVLVSVYCAGIRPAPSILLEKRPLEIKRPVPESQCLCYCFDAFANWWIAEAPWLAA